MIIPAAQIKKTDGRDNVRSSGPGAASGVAPSWNAARKKRLPKTADVRRNGWLTGAELATTNQKVETPAIFSPNDAYGSTVSLVGSSLRRTPNRGHLSGGNLPTKNK